MKTTAMKFLMAMTMLAGVLGSWSSPLSAEFENPEAAELFLVAQKAFDDGFYDVTIRYIEEFLQKYPATDKLVEAQLILGQCYFFKSQYLKAYEVFQGLLQYPEFKDVTLFWLGETYFKGSDYKQAKKYYQQLIELYPDSSYVPQAWYSLGWTDFVQNNYTEAKSRFLEMVKRFPVNPLSEDAAFKIGECEHNMNSHETAIAYFKNYIIKYPQSTRQPDAYFYIAEDYYYLEDFLTAITCYAKAADIAYDRKLIFMSKVSMGWSYLKLGKYDLSRRYFDEAQALAEKEKFLSDDILLGKATLFSATGKVEDALKEYDRMIERFPNSSRLGDAYLGKANSEYALQNYRQAILAYQWIIDNYADDPGKQEILEKAYYGLAWTYLKSGNPDLSIRSFENVMNKSASKVVKVSALTQIGDAYQDNNDLEKAIDVYDRILRDYPDSLYTDYVQFRQGVALLKLNKLEAATLSFQSLQANFPGSKYLNDVKYYLGLAYFKKEDWNRVVACIQDYLDSHPQPQAFAAEATYILGLSYFNLAQYEDALYTFQKLLRDYPDQKAMIPVADLNIAKALSRLGKSAEAVEKFTAVVAAYPATESAQEALLALGDHHVETDEFPLAIAAYEQFLRDFPGSDKVNWVYYQLGQVYEAQGNFEKALNAYKTIKTEDKALYTKAELAIADIFAGETDPQSALATYENIVAGAPEFKRDAFVKIAAIYKNQKEYEKAVDVYRKALSSDKGLSRIQDAELQFHLGDTYESANQADKAVEAYLRIPYLFDAEKSWAIKSCLRVARIFEDKEQWDQAKITYQKILDYKTEESKYAGERIDWIDANIPRRQ